MTTVLSSETSANKGEWSEIYTLIKLLNDGRIYAADENLKHVKENLYLPIIKIRREETPGEIYDYHTKEEKESVVKIYHNGEFIKSIAINEFEVQTALLYRDLSSIPQGNIKLCELEGLEEFLNNIFVQKVKADSNHKADIIMEFIDIHTGFRPLAGFSIKSQMGSASTLLNASQATNFIYKVKNINDTIMDYVNSIQTRTKIIDRMAYLENNNAELQFFKINNETFADNLEMIDSRMAEIMSYVMLYRYKDNIKSTVDIIEKLCSDNPLHYRNNQIYRFKYKRLLSASALGMLPATQWDGIDEANGGYIIVKNDGDIVAYYLYNRNFFEEYLLKATYLEAASTERYNYAKVYKQDNEYFINLNLQIRFKA